jgi:hypothetical protein
VTLLAWRTQKPLLIGQKFQEKFRNHMQSLLCHWHLEAKITLGGFAYLAVECELFECLAFTVGALGFEPFFPLKDAIHMKIMITERGCINFRFQTDATLLIFNFYCLIEFPL